MEALSFIFSVPISLRSPLETGLTPRRCRHHRFNGTQPHASIIHPSHQETRRQALEARLRSLDASSAADLAYATFSKISLPPAWEHLLNVLSSHGITGKALSRIASRLGIHSLFSLDPNAITPIIEYLTETLSTTESQRNRILTQRPDLLSIQLPTLTATTDALLAYLNPRDLKQIALRWPGVLVLSSKSIARVTGFLSSQQCLLTPDNIRCLLRRAPWILVYDIDHDMAPVICWLQDEILPHSSHPLSTYLLASPQLLGSTRTQMSDVMHFLRDEIHLNVPSSVSVVRQFPPLLACSATDVLRPATEFLLNDVCLERSELRKVVRAFPAVLTLDIEKDMKVVVEFFRAKGITNVARLVSRLPPLLGYDLESDIIPKTNYVERELGLSLFDVLRFPAYFSYDLRNKIEPRTRFLQSIGVRIAQVGLNIALSSSDQVFCVRVRASLESYTEFKRTGTYQRREAMLNSAYCSDEKGTTLEENVVDALDGSRGLVSEAKGSAEQMQSFYRLQGEAPSTYTLPISLSYQDDILEAFLTVDIVYSASYLQRAVLLDMGGSPKTEDIAGDLHVMFVKLASVCLKEKPSDVDRYCLEWLAKQHGMKLENTVALTRGHSVALDDDISEFVNDIETAQQASSTFASTAHKTPAFAYASSEEGEVRTVASLHSNSDIAEADDSEHVEATSEGQSLDVDSDYLFSTDGIAADELELETNKYANDSRMQSLFRAWDKDGSGAVDFVELVIALHKFEKVAAAGIDIHVASEALVQFVESDTERELNLREFAKVIILFAHNNFQTRFEEVADHMLAVATGTSEEAVLMAANGEDVSELEAADKEEEEFLTLTAKGMADDISRNITRIRTKRVMFSKGGSKS